MQMSICSFYAPEDKEKYQGITKAPENSSQGAIGYFSTHCCCAIIKELENKKKKKRYRLAWKTCR